MLWQKNFQTRFAHLFPSNLLLDPFPVRFYTCKVEMRRRPAIPQRLGVFATVRLTPESIVQHSIMHFRALRRAPKRKSSDEMTQMYRTDLFQQSDRTFLNIFAVCCLLFNIWYISTRFQVLLLDKLLSKTSKKSSTSKSPSNQLKLHFYILLYYLQPHAQFEVL